MVADHDLNNPDDITSWNAKIKDARDKPPVSLMESLRRMEMVEFEERRSQAEKHEGPLMENVMKIIEKKKSLTRGMGIMYAGQLEFEVMVGTFYQYKVDLNTKTCSCLEWGLSGIPCAHAAACIMHARLDFAPFVDPCYHIETMRRIYRTIIHPLPGTNDWVQTQLMGTDPPVFRKKTGRPKKIRKRGPTEKTDHTGKRLTKHGLKQYCSGCGHTGHNKRCCPVLKAASGEASQPQNASQQIPSQEGCQQVSSQMKRKGNFSGDDGAGPSSQPMQSHKRSKNLVMEDHDGGLSQPSQPIPSQPIPSQTRPSQSRVQKNKGQNKGKKKGNNAAPETASYVREELPDESQQDPSQTRPSQSRVQKNKGQNKGKKKGNNAAPETASYAREELPDESQQDPSQTRPSQSRVQKKQGYKGKKQDKSSKTATASHATASHVTASHAEGSRQNDTIILDDDDDIVLSDCRDIVLSPQPLKTKKTKVYRQGWRKSPRKGRQFRSTQ